jgi:hypothetical protein
MAKKGFLNLPSKTTRSTPSLHDKMCASELNNAIKQKGRLLAPYSLKAWANEFRILRQHLDQDELRLLDVLDWYRANFGKAYVPRAYSAKSFRDKFLAIEDAMKRAAKRTPTSATISPAAKSIAKRLTDSLLWPKGAAETLPAAIQQAIETIGDLRDRISGELTKEAVNFRKTKSYRERVLEHLYTTLTTSLIDNWFRDVHRQLTKWEAWDGNWTPFAFTRDNEKFHTIGRGLLTGRGTPAAEWDKLQEELYASSKA